MEELDKDFRSYISEIADNIDSSFVKKINNIYLNDNEISVLKKYNIDYNNCGDFNYLLYLIDEVLDSDDEGLDDLEEVSKTISERNYYMCTKK